MKLDTADAEFAAAAGRWLEDLDDETLSSFDSVLAISPGYYPSTLHDLWLAEVSRRGIAAVEGPVSVERVVTLPVGHPLDYDWRFTDQTRADLLDVLQDVTAPGDELVYFGTPTLFVDAHAGLPDRKHLLIDSNGAMVRTLQRHLGVTAALQHRLGRDALPDEATADTLVLDPPWYPDATNAFLSEASRMLKRGGHILISQPTVATRPGVEAERAQLIADASRMGLDLVRSDLGGVRYVTPHFERMSLGDAKPGLQIPDDWRSGDLLVFERNSERVELPFTPAPSEEQWREVSFGPVRIKLRQAGVVELGEIAPGLSRLASVSRRDPLREHVGFWSSGNRVRSLVDVAGIARLVELCEDDLADMKFTHLSTKRHAHGIGLDSRVADVLFDLLLLEYQEHTAGGFGVLR